MSEKPQEIAVIDRRGGAFGAALVILAPVALFCGGVALASWLIKGTIGGTIAASIIFGVVLLLIVLNVCLIPHRIALVGDHLEVSRYLGGMRRRPLTVLRASKAPVGDSVSAGATFRVTGPGVKFTIGLSDAEAGERIVAAIVAANPDGLQDS